MRRHRWGRSLIAALAGGMAVATACTPPPPAAPPAGCYDSTTGPDYYYSGVPNVMGNMDYWSSRDGSCTDVGHDLGSVTLVLAADRAGADIACTAAGLSVTSGRWVDEGYTAMPPTAWACPQQIIAK